MLPVLIILGLTLALLAWPALRSRLRERRRAALRARPFPPGWIALLEANVPLYRCLPPALRDQLHGHVQVLLAEKDFHGTHGLQVTDAMRVVVAAQAALLQLNRPPDYFPDLHSIVLYPARFVVDREVWDEAGVRRSERQVLSGESWEEGQLVLSWDDTLAGGMESGDGYNVVLHEFAHQLDHRSGATNGVPAGLGRRERAAWTAAFLPAYERHCARVDAGEDPWLDPYAAESPAEFFAVLTEYFFELPQELRAEYPDIYARLRDYYRVDPADWPAA